ncbi:MAG: uroporphyrin-III C/tetrapyrrole (Corrin/Porphyrin) methyltransferase, rRNA [Candidatus Parcubacteria bacterium]
MGTLSIVATPIGNLEDITLRALRILKESDVVFCEDTRMTGKLLSHYDIHTKTLRCDANKEAVCAQAVIARLEAGERVAYVTDAGTPGMSDPGAYLVSRVREALPSATIEAIPGASSLTAALSIAGITEHSFRFLGFFPHKKGRQTLFKEIAASEEPVLFLESTHRIMKTLESLAEYAPLKKVTLCRELTKKFEEVAIGTAVELLHALTERPERQKGEFVVMVN